MHYNVAVLGASSDESRYSNQALHLLSSYGHQVFPIHPSLSEISNIPVYKDLTAISQPIHTLTVYVRPEISATLVDKIITLRPQRVIFNPGTENAELSEKLSTQGIADENACTLVLLRTGQF